MELRVMRDDSGQLRQTIEERHYLHRWPDARSLPFGYRLIVNGQETTPDGELWGAVVFKKPQHHQQRGLFGYRGLPTSWQVLDLARVWVHPCLQRKVNGHALCVFSQMVSHCARRVQKDWLAHHPPRFPNQPYHIVLLISYCDLSHHDGVAYRASGFQWKGYTSDRTKELYYRRLKQPLKQWQPVKPYQPPLPMFDMPLVHRA